MKTRVEKFELEFELCGDQYLAIGKYDKWSGTEVGTTDEYGRDEIISIGGLDNIRFSVLERLGEDGGISVLGNIIMEDFATDEIIKIYDN